MYRTLLIFLLLMPYKSFTCEYWLTDLPEKTLEVIQLWSDLLPVSGVSKNESIQGDGIGHAQRLIPLKYPFIVDPQTVNPINLVRIEDHIVSLRAMAAVTLWSESGLLLELNNRVLDTMVANQKAQFFSESIHFNSGTAFSFYRLYSKELGKVDLNFLKYKYLRKIFYRLTFRSAQVGRDISSQPWVIVSNEWIRQGLLPSATELVVSNENAISFIQNYVHVQSITHSMSPMSRSESLSDIVRAFSILKENLQVLDSKRQIIFMQQFERKIYDQEEKIWIKSRDLFKDWSMKKDIPKAVQDYTLKKLQERLDVLWRRKWNE